MRKIITIFFNIKERITNSWDSLNDAKQAAAIASFITSTLFLASIPIQTKLVGKESFSSSVNTWRVQKRAEAYSEAIRVAEKIAGSSCLKNACDSYYDLVKKSDIINNLYLYSIDTNKATSLFGKSIEVESPQKEKEKHLAKFKVLARKELGGND